MTTQVPAFEVADLFAICASVDFEGAIDHALTVDPYKSIPIYTLHKYQTLDLKCPLCQVFLGIVHGWGDLREVMITVVTSSNPVYWWDHIKFPMLELWTSTLQDPHCQLLYWQRLDDKVIHPVSATTINFDAIKAAVQLCRETHSTCHKSPPGDNPFLKLIDCETRQVVLANVHAYGDYAALSYVWVQLHHGLKHIGALSQSLPATIEDAIQMTRRSGLRYLWIDRYCIDQDNEVELSSQIAMMDAIYHNAAVTIIAACGEDPSYGLPRVNHGSQEQEQEKSLEFTIGNAHFFPISSRSRLAYWGRN